MEIINDLPDRANLARSLKRLCQRRGLRLLVAGDPRLATKVGADGIHFSEAAAQRRLARLPHRPRLLTVSCHDAAAVHRAEYLGADACLLSPVFLTESHPGARPLGPWRFARLAHTAKLPVYALGGVNQRTIRRLSGSSVCGIAAIDGLSAGGR